MSAKRADGQEAVTKYVECTPDVVTLDIVMPGTDGLYAMQNILRFDPQANIVVVSALDQTKLISEAIRIGAEFHRQALPARATAGMPSQLRAQRNRGRRSDSCSRRTPGRAGNNRGTSISVRVGQAGGA